MRLVILETPYAGEIAENIRYARACVRDCLARGEAPIASHLLYTQDGILDDGKPEERAAGIAAGHAWYRAATACVAYIDRGISDGMKAGITEARRRRVPVETRRLYRPADEHEPATNPTPPSPQKQEQSAVSAA